MATIGVDIGKSTDPTAVCVAEVDDRGHFLIRHLNRLQLGLPYPEIAGRIASIAESVARRTATVPTLYLDATGVGQPVVDLLTEHPVKAVLRPVYFVHGDRRIVKAKGVSLGKAHLVSRLQALLCSGRVHLPNNPEAQALARELLDYEIRVDENGTDRYGAFRVGTHDDLVTALGLAVQVDPPGCPTMDQN